MPVFDPVLDEPVPEHLIGFARKALAAAPGKKQSEVIPLPRRTVRGRSLPRWAALAASLLLGIIAGRFVPRVDRSGFIATRNGHVMASGLLADALTRQLVIQQRVSQPVRIGISFRSKSGEHCRTFSMRTPAVAGLACNAQHGWRLEVLSGAEERVGTPGHYRQAASSLPPAVVTAVSEEIAGDPLDARAEAVARSRAWPPHRR
jgi:hypothetical protein